VWTWEDIEREWLREGRIAYTAEEAVNAFNLVDRTLGRAWMKALDAGPAAVRVFLWSEAV